MLSVSNLEFEYLFDLDGSDMPFTPTEELELLIVIDKTDFLQRVLLIDSKGIILYLELDSQAKKGRVKSSIELSPEFLTQFTG